MHGNGFLRPGSLMIFGPHTSTRRLLIRLLCLLIGMCVLRPLSAQVDRAGLKGTVTDASDRVIPAVIVVAVQNDSGLRRETVGSKDGSFDIPELPVGVYTITFTANGFEVLRFENVVQVVGQTRTLNATLKVSGTNERVEVSSSSEQLDQTSDALGTRVEKEQVDALPLQSRSFA